MQILLGTYTKKESEGIYTLELDEHKSECRELIHYLKIQSPTYLVKEGSMIFSVCQKDEKAGVAYFENGVLKGQVLNQTKTPSHISFDSNHQLIFTANYHQGQINSYRFINGQIESHQKIVYPTGSNAHYIKTIKDLNSTLVCDLGLDRIIAYSLDENKKLQEKQILEFPKKSGPRHLVSHPSKPLLYVLSELTYEIFTVKYDEEFKIINKEAGNPTLETKDQHGSAIRISKDGNYLYTSNRADNTISVFNIDQYGSITLIQHIPTHGEHPRDFDISPNQKYVLVANMNSETCTLFQRDTYSGRLKLAQKGIFVHEPSCVVF
jgi:6-phosphogluconolactonase